MTDETRDKILRRLASNISKDELARMEQESAEKRKVYLRRAGLLAIPAYALSWVAFVATIIVLTATGNTTPGIWFDIWGSFNLGTLVLGALTAAGWVITDVIKEKW